MVIFSCRYLPLTWSMYIVVVSPYVLQTVHSWLQCPHVNNANQLDIADGSNFAFRMSKCWVVMYRCWYGTYTVHSTTVCVEEGEKRLTWKIFMPHAVFRGRAEKSIISVAAVAKNALSPSLSHLPRCESWEKCINTLVLRTDWLSKEELTSNWWSVALFPFQLPFLFLFLTENLNKCWLCWPIGCNGQKSFHTCHPLTKTQFFAHLMLYSTVQWTAWEIGVGRWVSPPWPPISRWGGGEVGKIWRRSSFYYDIPYSTVVGPWNIPPQPPEGTPEQLVSEA